MANASFSDHRRQPSLRPGLSSDLDCGRSMGTSELQCHRHFRGNGMEPELTKDGILSPAQMGT